jgi:hypothetical protein
MLPGKCVVWGCGEKADPRGEHCSEHATGYLYLCDGGGGYGPFPRHALVMECLAAANAETWVAALVLTFGAIVKLVSMVAHG